MNGSHPTETASLTRRSPLILRHRGPVIQLRVAVIIGLDRARGQRQRRVEPGVQHPRDVADQKVADAAAGAAKGEAVVVRWPAELDRRRRQQALVPAGPQLSMVEV